MKGAISVALLAVAAAFVDPGTPDGVPESFDCSLRKLAYEFGQSLRPDRGSFLSLFEALQLQFCDEPTPADADAYVPPTYDAPAGAQTLVYVSAADGVGLADALRWCCAGGRDEAAEEEERT